MSAGRLFDLLGLLLNRGGHGELLVWNQLDYVVQSEVHHGHTGLSSPVVPGWAHGRPSSNREGTADPDRIVAAAAQVVAERGASAASLDEVGERAAASRSQLYHYFDDKADLLRAVAEATNDSVLAPQAPLFAQMDTLAGLRIWTDALVAFQVERQGLEDAPSPT